MSTNILSQISADSLQAGGLATVLPEYYQLSAIVENSPWHLNQSVFDHSVKVMRSFEEIMRFEFLPENSRKKAISYFATEVLGMSRLNQLKTVVLLHDIAKPLVFKKNPDGTAGCSPLHEALGAAMVGNFQQRLELSDAVAVRVRQMILLHGTISEFLNISLEKNDKVTFFKLFEKLSDDLTNELLCFIFADIMGSDLKTSSLQAYEERISLIQSWLLERFPDNE